jgi:hypothetical protein
VRSSGRVLGSVALDTSMYLAGPSTLSLADTPPSVDQDTQCVTVTWWRSSNGAAYAKTDLAAVEPAPTHSSTIFLECPVPKVARPARRMLVARRVLACFDTGRVSRSPTEAVNLLAENICRIGHGYNCIRSLVPHARPRLVAVLDRSRTSSATRAAAALVSSCSHTRRTSQPTSRNATLTRRSRSTLRITFADQYPALVLGGL